MQSDKETFGESLTIPDPWQRRALSGLRAGRDVVVHAPTGAGKTYVFELFVEASRSTKAVYTVPTRALANDKFREWSERGWDVGLTTGDVRHRPEARVVVATLETQRAAMLRGEGPDLFVVDEYQLVGDAQRGPGYEVTIAAAPPSTQLLLMSGSVANPVEVADWLSGRGREVELVSESRRPVPLDEVFAEALLKRSAERDSIRGAWPSLVNGILSAGMGPVLLFAPRRAAAEDLARKLASELPDAEPLELTPEQRRVAGRELTGLLKRRVAYHHSGLDYRSRAGVVEPLAKAGQLQAVVATTGLGAGVNFSMRSVLVTDREYRIEDERRLLRPDELLQMFGRAGRRGLDDRGYVVVAPKQPRKSDGRPLRLKRSTTLDWAAMLGVMRHAVETGADPAQAARRLAKGLFSEERVRLGLGESLSKVKARKVTSTKAERERDPSRDEVIEMQNSVGQWERRRGRTKVKLGEALVLAEGEWVHALSLFDTLAKVDAGAPCRFDTDGEPRLYGREMPVAVIDAESDGARVLLVKSFRRRLRERMASETAARRKKFSKKAWRRKGLEKVFGPLFPLLASGGRLDEFVDRNGTLRARLRYEEATVLAWRDARGNALLNPPLRLRRREFDSPFVEREDDDVDQLAVASPAEAWLNLGLVDEDARPTRRGVVFSFFSRGEGLAVAAALEDEEYPVDELVRDLANLRAGHRFRAFAGAERRLSYACRRAYGSATCPGYLKGGLPPEYGEGAAEALLLEGPERERLDEDVRAGDLERIRLEWRSLLALVAKAPDLEWERWRELRAAAAKLVGVEGPNAELPELPPLAARQRRRFAREA